MNLHAGTFIRSTEALDNTYFEDATIFITEHNEKGALGFMISRPFNRSLDQLEEFRYSKPIPLYEGGPVDQEHLFFLHLRPDVIEEASFVSPGIYLGGNFSQAVEALNNGTISAEHIRIFIGYSGWNKDELEAEINEGSWEIIDGKKEDIFKTLSTQG